MENKRVENYTRNTYYEQVVSAGLTFLNIPEKVRVQIKQFINRLSTWDCQIAALAQPCPYDENIYELYVDPAVPDMEIGEMLAHELIHIEQMVNGRLDLRPADKGFVIWEGKERPATPYSRNFPWEQEAYKRMGSLWRDIRKSIRKK